MRLIDIVPETFRRKSEETEAQETLPKVTQSLCPECLKVVDATIYQEGDCVFMRKRCPNHGLYRELLSSDASFFKLMLERDRAITRGVTRPVDSNTKACPGGCGICSEHLSGPIMMNIDLTNRCNLNCPICFANAGARGEVLEPDIDQIRRLLDTACEVHEVQPPCLQYTGGEPTVHPEFLTAIREAKKRGFAQVQIATNGIKFARDPELAARAGEAGLNVVYLQFDGLNDQVYRQTRGRPLLELKLAAIENLYEANVRTILVPTIAKGINKDQIGPISRFAVEHTDRITAVSWQPIAFTGRLAYQERLAQRFTVTDLAREIERQTGFAQMYRDWYPFCFVDPFVRFLEALRNERHVTMSCNPLCGAGTYLIVDSKTHEVWPIPAFVEVEGLMSALSSAADQISRGGFLKKLSLTRQMHRLRSVYHEESAPGDWSFEQFIDFMMDFADFRQRYQDNNSRIETNSRNRYRPLLMASMHFQDVYNYQLDRLRRCVIHYAAPDGRVYPFCSYNSGPCHRNRVEQRFAVPLDEYRTSRSPRKYVTKANSEADGKSRRK